MLCDKLGCASPDELLARIGRPEVRTHWLAYYRIKRKQMGEADEELTTEEALMALKGLGANRDGR